MPNLMFVLVVATTLFYACSSFEEQSVFIDLPDNKALWGLADDMTAMATRRVLVESQDAYFQCTALNTHFDCKSATNCVWLMSSGNCVTNCEKVLEKDICESLRECTYQSKTSLDNPKLPAGCYIKPKYIDKCSDVRKENQCQFMSPRCFFNLKKCMSICSAVNRGLCKKIELCTKLNKKCIEKVNFQIQSEPMEESCEGLKKAPCMKLEKCMFQNLECVDIDGSD